MTNKIILLILIFLGINQAIVWGQGRKSKAKAFHYSDHFQTQIKKDATKAEKVLQTMYGHYSNKKLAEELQNPMYGHQELVILPIWKEKRKSEHWFLITWFAGSFYNKPLAEGFFLMENIGRDSFSIKLFLAPVFRPLEWQQEKPYEDLDPKQLVSPEGCVNLGVWQEKEQEVSWTGLDLCKLNLGEQVDWNQINLHFEAKGLTNLSKFYTADRQLLFAYPLEQGNFFERLDKRPKKRR